MTARRRAPRTPEQRQAQALRAMIPGTLNGTVANAKPIRAVTKPLARAQAKVAAAAGGGASLHVGPSAPTNGSVFWYDTDAAC